MMQRKLHTAEIALQRLRPDQTGTSARAPIIGLLDNIRSLYNVGSMFRTADGVFLQELILTGYTPHPPRKEIEKTALGATASVPHRYIRDPMEAVAAVRESGARLCVLEQTTASIPCSAVEPAMFPLCVVVGNELTGVSPALVSAADFAIEIPMHGTKHSLNAAVAFGIAVFELRKIWEGNRHIISESRTRA
jgi:23S rRNA (guanosine2251-2'-O)-methyltransferase